MNNVGYPKFQYHIPYDKDDDWYLILTSKRVHFYFNQKSKLSFWQLSDLFQHCPSVVPDDFIKAIDFNETAILFAKNNGVKILSKSKLPRGNSAHEPQPDEVHDEGTADKMIPIVHSQSEPNDVNDEGYSTEELVQDAMDEETKDSLITDLLREEGLLNSEDVDKEQEQEQSSEKKETKQEKNNKTEPAHLNVVSTVIQGYSSSEEEDEEDEEEKDTNQENEEPDQQSSSDQNKPIVEKDAIDDFELGAKKDGNEHIEEDYVATDEIQGNENEPLSINLGLGNDLDLDLELESEDSRKSDFIELLDNFKSRISVYEPWSLIEEELINELVKCPQFFAIDNTAEREQIFNEWCVKQAQDKSDEPETEPEETFEEEIDGKFPTPMLSYLFILQDFKKEIKKSYYDEFYNKKYRELAQIKLTKNKMEETYNKFKTFLNQFAKYEKSTKQSPNYDATVNLKKLKLQNFLNNAKIDIQLVEYHINPKLTDLQNWIQLVNKFEFPETLVEDLNNFIVGDEKRLQCYLELVDLTVHR